MNCPIFFVQYTFFLFPYLGCYILQDLVVKILFWELLFDLVYLYLNYGYSLPETHL